MTLKKIAGYLHLWLGLISGVLVFVIAITGCLYAFQEEISDLTQPYRFVEEQPAEFLPPSVLQKIAATALPEKQVHALMYQGRARSAKAIFYSEEPSYYYQVYINQYSGEVLKVKDENTGFFRFVLDGHFYLWLPHEIGKQVVSAATLVFLAMALSGLILWWPRNRNGRKQRFTIKFNARWRRKNYDLHNVGGFYAMWAAIIFAITGLVWGYEWFMNGYYKTISGGQDFVEYTAPQSPANGLANSATPAIDKVWQQMCDEYPHAGTIEVHPPEDEHACIAANANPDRNTYWQTDYRYFDQYTLKELPVEHIWGRLQQTSAAGKLMRMNYDIHVGAVLGLPGKVLAFFMSLIIASLPVTGFMIWYGRKYKKKSPQTATEYKWREVGAFAEQK